MEGEQHPTEEPRTDAGTLPTSLQKDHKPKDVPANQTASPTKQKDLSESQTARTITAPFMTQRALFRSPPSSISSHSDLTLSVSPVPHALQAYPTSSVELQAGTFLYQPQSFSDRFSFSSRHVPGARLFYASSPGTVLPPAVQPEWYSPENPLRSSGSDVAVLQMKTYPPLQHDASSALHHQRSRQSFFALHRPPTPNIYWSPPSIASYPDPESQQLLPGASELGQRQPRCADIVFPASAGIGRHRFLVSPQNVQYALPVPAPDSQSAIFMSTEGQSQDLVTSQDYDLPITSTENTFSLTSHTVRNPVRTSKLRADSAEFIPKTVQQPRQGTRGQLPPVVAAHSSLQSLSSQTLLMSAEVNSGSYAQALRQMETYAQKMLQPDIEQRIVRIPATHFNEQKLEGSAAGTYLLLGMPQTPALRGQEALSRVTCALEVLLRLRGRLAVIISNYKYRECYLRRAPNNAFPRPSSEGSHDILMFGIEIGIVCIQVTCVERSTSKGTVKKQVRDTIKQLRKDEDAVCLLMQDLTLPELALVRVLALPNLSREELREKLETRMIKKLMSTLGCGENLEGILTSDHLPLQGQRHFPDKGSYDLLHQWLDQTAKRGTALPIQACMQMFARYSGEWSAPEVWTQEKPRVEVRTLLDAALETSRRYGLQVLTQEQEAILNSPRSHVIMVGVAGSGATLLLQLKATQWLNRGAHVVVFIPEHLTGLRQMYRATDLFQEHSTKVHLWNGGSPEAGNALTSVLCTSLAGEEADISQLQGEVSAVFDGINLDNNLVSFGVERATALFQSVWMATSRPLEVDARSHGYYEVKLRKVTRIPTSVQALLRHGLQADCDERMREESGALDAVPFPLVSGHTSNASASHPASLSVTALEPLLSASAALDENRSYAEASSDHGLPCDGPLPVMILHPAHCSQQTRVVDCSICCRKLARVLQELGQLDPLPSTTGKKTERAVTAVKRDHDDNGEVGHDDEKRDNSDLQLDAVVITDTVEDAGRLAHSLQQHGAVKEQFLRSMRALPDLPHVMGTERPLVVYAGHVRVSQGRVLHALVSRLRDVISLCQGQLVLVLEVQWLAQTSNDVPDIERGQRPRLKPFELELQLSIEESEKEHSVNVRPSSPESQTYAGHQDEEKGITCSSQP